MIVRFSEKALYIITGDIGSLPSHWEGRYKAIGLRYPNIQEPQASLHPPKKRRRYPIIEEAPAFLHPAKKRKWAIWLVRQLSDLRPVVVETNDDFVMREFNNLIALSAVPSDSKAWQYLEKLDYVKTDGIAPERVAVYEAKDGALLPILIEDNTFAVEHINCVMRLQASVCNIISSCIPGQASDIELELIDED